MLFLTFSNADIQFIEKELTWKSYALAKALPTTNQIKLIDKIKFAEMALDENFQTFVIHFAALKSFSELIGMMVHPLQTAQIVALQQNQVFIKVSPKYINYAIVF